MENAIHYCAYKLKKSADPEAFLAAAKALGDGYISKQKGFIKWEQFKDGDTWADAITFETMADLQAFEAASQDPEELALVFYNFINMPSCKVNRFTVVATH